MKLTDRCITKGEMIANVVFHYTTDIHPSDCGCFISKDNMM